MGKVSLPFDDDFETSIECSRIFGLQVMFSLQMLKKWIYSKCLKSKLVWSSDTQLLFGFQTVRLQTHFFKFVWNPSKILCISDITQKCLKAEQNFIFRKNRCLKTELLGNQTVIECLKSILVQISDRHLLYFKMWYNKVVTVGFHFKTN